MIQQFACETTVGQLFKAANSDEVQTYIRSLILPYLTCPKKPLCDQEKTKKIYDFIGRNVVFTDAEAKRACNLVDTCNIQMPPNCKDLFDNVISPH